MSELEERILETKVPGIGERLAHELIDVMQKLRKLDLKKNPSISETLDWARALIALNATSLDESLVSDTLNVILKYEGDIKKAQSELGRLIEKKAEEQKTGETAAETAAPPEAPAKKKGALH